MKFRTHLALVGGVMFLLVGCPPKEEIPPPPTEEPAAEPAPIEGEVTEAPAAEAKEYPAVGIKIAVAEGWTEVDADASMENAPDKGFIELMVGETAEGAVYTVMAADETEAGLDAFKPMIDSIEFGVAAAPAEGEGAEEAPEEETAAAGEPPVVAFAKDAAAALPRLHIMMMPAEQAKQAREGGMDPVEFTISAIKQGMTGDEDGAKIEVVSEGDWTANGITKGKMIRLHGESAAGEAGEASAETGESGEESAETAEDSGDAAP